MRCEICRVDLLPPEAPKPFVRFYGYAKRLLHPYGHGEGPGFAERQGWTQEMAMERNFVPPGVLLNAVGGPRGSDPAPNGLVFWCHPITCQNSDCILRMSHTLKDARDGWRKDDLSFSEPVADVVARPWTEIERIEREKKG